jgi:dTDP-L-rhamnose 4-epimerase
MSTVLITGGAGFIGSRLAARLTGEGHEVTVADVLHPQVHSGRGWPDELPAEVVRHPFDVTVPTAWDALLSTTRPDVVVHLAAETGTGQSLTEASRHGRVNVVGTTELVDGLSRAGHVPSRFVLASSRAVYGEGRWITDEGVAYDAAVRDAGRLAAGEWDPAPPAGAASAGRPLPHRAADTQPRPSNVYAATKLAQEHVLGAWASAHSADLSVLRLQNVYGPGQSLTNPYTGIVSLFAQIGLRRETIDVYEDGSIVRDFVFVDDVVTALATAVHAPPGAVLADIGSGDPTTLLGLARVICAQTGAPEPHVSGKYRLGDVRAASADIGDAAALLGYTPAFDLQAGIARLLEWIRASSRP